MGAVSDAVRPPACQCLNQGPSPSPAEYHREKNLLALSAILPAFHLPPCLCMAGLVHRRQEEGKGTGGFCPHDAWPRGRSWETRKGALDKESRPGLSPISVFSRLCDLGQANPPLWVSTFPSCGKYLLVELVEPLVEVSEHLEVYENSCLSRRGQAIGISGPAGLPGSHRKGFCLLTLPNGRGRSRKGHLLPEVR